MLGSDERHPADFLAQLASAIKAVRDRGGKWNKTADTIQWAHERIERRVVGRVRDQLPRED